MRLPCNDDSDVRKCALVHFLRCDELASPTLRHWVLRVKVRLLVLRNWKIPTGTLIFFGINILEACFCRLAGGGRPRGFGGRGAVSSSFFTLGGGPFVLSSSFSRFCPLYWTGAEGAAAWLWDSAEGPAVALAGEAEATVELPLDGDA